MRIGDIVRRAYERGERAVRSFLDRLPETELEKELAEAERELAMLQRDEKW